jgi:FlaA1/EpsC-like NDP-sugar epimerase
MNTRNSINKYSHINIVPRWIIFFIDLAVTTTALMLAFVVKQNLSFAGVNWENLITTIVVMLIVNAFVFAAIKTYAGIVRYTGIQDAFRIAVSIFASSVVLYLISIISSPLQDNLVLNNVVIIVYGTFSFLALLAYRVCIKVGISYLRSYKMKRKTVVIFGAGEAGVATKRVLDHDAQNQINILAFVDDDRKKSNKALDGIKIIGFNDLLALTTEHPIDELIIASFTITTNRKNELVDFCLNHDIKVLVVPSYNNWTEGSFSSRQLRTINIEELLERDPIHINNNQIRAQIKGKRVLVTGAAGSIGSEIVRQLLHYSPELIVLCDQAETPLHSLELELQEINKQVNCVSFLASITNETRMRQLFTGFKPHYVYHAAAYKHVPMMELCPTEAVCNNALGTRLIADLAVEYGVERFVMVSTDKAVNPTNVMGASKRLAEIYVQGLSKHKKQTKFITTRFGNVLGSNGSVINTFKHQIEKGGPITVTHPNITRYFMTIPEACQLVLEAGSMGNGGEIFVFDMGKPVAISDLAKKMIRLYGLIPNIDIDIVYSGLRPGEKLYEELLNDAENTGNTYHDKIMIAKVRDVEFLEVANHFNELVAIVSSEESDMYLVAKMKEIVPEFLSNNSVFENLDRGGKVVGMD